MSGPVYEIRTALEPAHGIDGLIVLPKGRVHNVHVDWVAPALQRAAGRATVLEHVVLLQVDAVLYQRINVWRNDLRIGGVVEAKVRPAPICAIAGGG